MGKVEGALQIRGKVGDLVFRVVNGENIVQLGSGPSREKVKNSPRFVRSRECSKEFEGASRAGEMVRRGLGPLVRIAKRKRLACDLVKMCSRWQLAERMEDAPPYELEEKLGQRSVPLSRMHSALSALRSDGCVLKVKGSHVEYARRPPYGATHVRATLHYFTVSDMAFDPSLGRHHPVHPQRSVTVESSISPLRRGSKVVVVPHLDRVTPEECQVSRDREAWMCAVLVEFLEVREGVALPLEEGCGWMVVGLPRRDDGRSYELLVASDGDSGLEQMAEVNCTAPELVVAGCDAEEGVILRE